MANWPRLRVTLEGESGPYDLDVRHFEDLKNALDTNDHGWRELDLYEHPSGKAFIWTGDIANMCYLPSAWCKERDEMDARAKLEGED